VRRTGKFTSLPGYVRVLWFFAAFEALSILGKVLS
jgi:hypothetical protein